ncbi:hypothetical protein [Amycolatopsis sp. EV170708-02-1]|uniref:hypothetical protein n=1 Tax=Amycolatopsis sp. EV170708-02-1 TaxID=2919322 RepID=UPI001F0BFB6B|nr:hypothetical protein [Amycolatopsis sp. EV170708-02-1]UMP06983.1 hypothetical protein MJQ72_20170 [Amycolatopsis sp. EV170708-02-1]
MQNRALELSELAEDLADSRMRLDMLEVPDDDRTAAVRSAFSWSYRALRPAEDRLFRMLGILPTGSFSDRAAAALAGQSLVDTRAQLDELVNRHLVGHLDDGRFRLNDLLRVYAAEQSVIADPLVDRLRAWQRLLDWYIRTARSAGRTLNPGKPRPVEPQLVKRSPGPQPLTSRSAALTWFQTEYASLDYAAKRAFEVEEYKRAWQLAIGLGDYLFVEQRWQAAIAYYDLGIKAAVRLGDREPEIRLRVEAAIVHLFTGGTAQAVAVFAIARAWAMASGARSVHALATYGLALASLVATAPRQEA